MELEEITFRLHTKQITTCSICFTLILLKMHCEKNLILTSEDFLI